MGHDRDEETNLAAGLPLTLSRRALLQTALAAGGIAGIAGSPLTAFAGLEPLQDKARTGSPNVALAMARLHNRPRFSDLPPKAIDHAKIFITSAVAAAAAGSTYNSSRIIRDLAKEHGGKPQATIWFDGTKVPMPEAARVNSVIANAAASDDTEIDTATHPGPELVPVGIVVAEAMGASGQDLLAAIVTGFEAQNRMGDALKDGVSTRIYASQTVAFGAVVIAARLLKLTDEQLAHAISITAMTMGGVAIGTNSEVRDYGGFNAALCAVNAALAAGRGYTANDDLLEARGGFLEIFGTGKTGELTADRKDWAIAKYLAIKLWPGAWPNSSLTEAAINAARQGNVSPDQVAKILISGPRLKTIGGSRHPKNFSEAIHSLPYFLASAVADKDFTWAHATAEKFTRPVVGQLTALIELDPSPSPKKYEYPWGGTVTIVTKSGARFTSTVDAQRGSVPRGIEWSDIDAKYHALMPASKLAPKRIEDALNMLHRLEQLKNVSELTRTIQPG